MIMSCTFFLIEIWSGFWLLTETLCNYSWVRTAAVADVFSLDLLPGRNNEITAHLKTNSLGATFFLLGFLLTLLT